MLNEPKVIRPTDTPPIPKQCIIMMGNGKPASPRLIKRFCDGIVAGCMDGAIERHHGFALGFAACLDAISRGTIDMGSDPIETMKQAYADVHNTTTSHNKVTDIMRFGD